MKSKILIVAIAITSAMTSYSQLFDFNACTASTQCNPFGLNQSLCGTSSKFWNLFGSPNYITFKKRINNQNVDTRAVLFQSEYYSPFTNYSDGLALEKQIKHGKAYRVSVVSSGLRGENDINNISQLRLSFDKTATHTNNNCYLGLYNWPSNSHLIVDVNPPALDTLNNFQDLIYKTEYYVVPNDDYSFVGIRGLPHSGVTLANSMLHKFEAKELNFQLQQSVQNIYCNTPVTLTLTLQNTDNIVATEYRWNLGSINNGWKYQGVDAAPVIVTPTNTLQLVWPGGSVGPSTNVSVVPYNGWNALNYLYTATLNYTNSNPPGLQLNGPTIIRTNIPTTNTFSLLNVPLGSTVVWDTPVPNNLGTFSASGNNATFLPNNLASGTIQLNARVTNLCGVIKEFPYSVFIRNACDELTLPSDLQTDPGAGGNSTLSWESRAPAGYVIEVQSSYSNFSTSSGTNSYSFYYGTSAVTGQFRVKAIGCPNGQSSEWSEWKSFSFPAPPPPNTACSTAIDNAYAIGNSQINVNWIPSTSAISYNLRLDRCCGGGTSSTTHSNLTGSSATITAPFSQSSYYIYIQVVCSSGVGPWIMKYTPVTGVYRTKNSFTNQPFIIQMDDKKVQTKYLVVYPNPVKNVMSVTFNSKSKLVYEVNLLDQNGRIIFQKNVFMNVGNNNLQLNVHNISGGIYTIRVRNSKELVEQRIIIQR